MRNGRINRNGIRIHVPSLTIFTIPRLVGSLLFLFASGAQPIAVAQPQMVSPPKAEVRAVWITTASSLDWPQTTVKTEQQSSLRKMVNDLQAAHFNTIFFQVRARGDSYYKSKYEPWAENLTGTLGKDPGWDPLAFLLTEAHSAGMEVHAWFNVYKILGPRPVAYTSPQHPSRVYPQWTVRYEGESWFDPGSPEIRSYLLSVSLDLVRTYNIDGMHFDFIRYPGRDFPDMDTYRKYGNGRDREDWRRANIDRFVSEFYDSATAIKPMLKVGSAPIGIYSGVKDGDALGGYYGMYQDSQGWLRKKKHDYLAPQVYWNIGSTQGDPDFSLLTKQWQQASTGRHIYVGIGAYKDAVLREIPSEIDTTRFYEAAGQAYFRYGSIKNFAVFGGRYNTLANIPPMPWKDSIPPLAPKALAVTEIAPNVFHLEWISPAPAKDGDTALYYNIYRSNTPTLSTMDVRGLIAITPNSDTHFIDTLKNLHGTRYYYAVTAFDKGNNESSVSIVASAVVREMLALGRKLSPITNLSVSGERGNPDLVAYCLAQRMDVELELVRDDDAGGQKVVATLARGEQASGTHIVGLGKAQLSPGKYLIRLRAGETTISEEPFEMRP